MRLDLRASFVLLVLGGAHPAGAEATNWFDAKRGCGVVGGYAQNARASELPGCTGKLPKDAPRVELALHDLKTQLMTAEELLDKGKLEPIDAILADVEAALKKPQPPHSELPDRWEQADHIYHQHIALLRSRRKLMPQIERLRAAYAAVTLAEPRNRKDVDGGPAEAQRAADSCVAIFAELRAAGVEDSTPVELEKKAAPRRLGELSADCARVSKSAAALVKEQARLAKTKRHKGKR